MPRDQRICWEKKSPHDDPCVIDDAYGVFVAPVANGGSDATGNGTRAAPYATLGKALAGLHGKSRVYVCDASYAERVVLSGELGADPDLAGGQGAQ